MTNPAVDAELHKSLLAELRSSGAITFNVGDSTPIIKGAGEPEPADGPSKTMVADTAARPVGVLILSNPANPDLVGRSVLNAAQAKGMLGANLGSVILEPLAQGTFRGLSYALWPWRRPLSSSHWFREVQRRALRSRILSWLRRAGELTRRAVTGEALEPRFAQPLRRMLEDARFPDEMSEAARRGLDRLYAETWRPFVVLAHNDFSFGNILLPCARRPWGWGPCGFVVIDWAGANLHGYPFYDLLSFCGCLRGPWPTLREQVGLHCAVLSCESEDAVSYLLASLGALGMDLEYFPEDRYVSLATALFARLARALGATQKSGDR